MDANPAAPAVASSDFVSSGLPGLDAVLGGLRLGDNVVWRVDEVANYRDFAAAFAAAAQASGRRVVYVRFARHPPLLSAAAVGAVYSLNALDGFESFTIRLHELIDAEGREVCYVFDCLSDLLNAWATDAMIANFFRVTCPHLYELATVAYFALDRDAHSFATIDAIRGTTQLLVDLYEEHGAHFLHPLKVWQRSSPTMFLPHRAENGVFTPITVSCEATRLFGRFADRSGGEGQRQLDFWERLFLRATDLARRPDEHVERKAMVEQLCRLLIGRDEKILALAGRYLSMERLLAIKHRLIGTGFIGGKAVGMLLARAILESDGEAGWRGILEPHDSFFIGSHLFHAYIVHNGWWPLFARQRGEAGYSSEASELREAMLHGSFPAEALGEFQKMLEHFGQYPIIVRSSSLLEDGFGNAFAGKYDSFFCVNQGAPEARLAGFLDALRRVYASTLGEEALEYRLRRGLARHEEQMAVLVQRVSGAYFGNRFFPPFSGVGISYNTYVWRHDIDPAAGMLRLVVGLGTRAVDRVGKDYPRIVSLDQPLLTPHGAPEERRRFSQHDVDVLDIEANRFRTVRASELGAQPPTLPMELFAERDRAGWVVGFDRLLRESDLAATLRRLLQTLARAYDYPVDIEFTGTYDSRGRLCLNLIQCRPLQTRGIQAERVAVDAAAHDVLFSSVGSFMGGSVALPLSRVVAVDAGAFVSLSESDRHELARIIGRINRGVVARDRQPTLLLGPGRWGTSTPRLGVPVRFAEINAFAAIAEVAFAAGGLQPELSFGSHFFQDLVEAGIFYVALDAERPGCLLDLDLLRQRPNRLAELMPDDARFADVLRIVDLAAGCRLLADIVSQKVACCRPGEAPAGPSA